MSFTVALKANGTILLLCLHSPNQVSQPHRPLLWRSRSVRRSKNPPSPSGLVILLVDSSSTFNAIISDLQQDTISQFNMADSTCSCRLPVWQETGGEARKTGSRPINTNSSCSSDRLLKFADDVTLIGLFSPRDEHTFTTLDSFIICVFLDIDWCFSCAFWMLYTFLYFTLIWIYVYCLIIALILFTNMMRINNNWWQWQK